jgi:hypothetical protein
MTLLATGSGIARVDGSPEIVETLLAHGATRE